MPQSIYLSDELYEHLKAHADSQGKTVDAVAQEVLKAGLPSTDAKTQVYSKEDEEKVKDRLRGLGYLD